MTTIAEETDAQLAQQNSDFSNWLDLPDDGLFTQPEDGANLFGPSTTSTSDAAPLPFCIDHPDNLNCLCNSWMGAWDIPQPADDVVVNDLIGVQEPDYSRTENWIPSFVRNNTPCHYCRSRRLVCYSLPGESSCTSCATLFRECSLTKSTTLEANNYIDYNSGTFLDTLHSVDEDSAREHGGLTGIKTLSSKTKTTDFTDDAPGSSKRNGIRFPRHAVKTLRAWLDTHADNPYPTEEEKATLERQTELKPSQIANWLANARRRRKATEKAKPRLASSPSLRPTTSAIDIPTPAKPWDELNPFERWKNSPPEHEPASITDIANAVANTEFPEDPASRSPSTDGRSSKRRKASSHGSGFSNLRAPSTTSLETGQTSSLSASSAAFSASNDSSHSTHGSFGSFSSTLAGKKDRRRRRRPAPAATARKSLTDDKKRIFQCTFCTDTFKSKYDWTRHEKSLHLSLEKWTCAPQGPIVTDAESGEKKCVYCDLYNPSSDHIESHNHRQCEDKGLDARTFYRKDHLRQHLRLMHGCEMSPAMDAWKSTAVNINSRCGFCAQRFSVWQERVDHLTAHFKAGDRMSGWKGCRGLDPAVAAQVTNAMPPYLIGIEAASPNPFSATNRGSWRLTMEFGGQGRTEEEQEPDDQIPSKSTCWEILTVQLGKYAKDMSLKGVMLTDEDLQREARKILYGSDDQWDQTAADNPEWLDLFKKAHGLDFIPSAIGGQGHQIPEDLETYTDLGLRIPFSVQLKAYNQNQKGKHIQDAATRPGPYTKAQQNLKQIYSLLSGEGVLYNGDQSCPHTKCSINLIDISKVDGNTALGSRLRRWCNEALSTAAAEKLTSMRALGTIRPIKSTEERHRALANLNSEPVGPEYNNSCSAPAAKESANATPTHVTSESTDPKAPQKIYMSRGWAYNYIPRHKYELPKEQRLFATTTPAWEDSGAIPAAVETSIPYSSNEIPSAAMDMSNEVPLPDYSTADLDLSDKDMMDLIQATNGENVEMDWNLPTTTMDDIANAAATSNVNLDDLTFDGVFDMPLDDTFEMQ